MRAVQGFDPTYSANFTFLQYSNTQNNLEKHEKILPIFLLSLNHWKQTLFDIIRNFSSTFDQYLWVYAFTFLCYYNKVNCWTLQNINGADTFDTLRNVWVWIWYFILSRFGRFLCGVHNKSATLSFDQHISNGIVQSITFSECNSYIMR